MVTGTRGSLAVPSLQHRWHEPGQGLGHPAAADARAIRPADGYHEQMNNFCGVIRGAEKPVVSGWDGTRTLATTLAITESARRGRPVRVEDMLTGHRAPSPNAEETTSE